MTPAGLLAVFALQLCIVLAIVALVLLFDSRRLADRLTERRIAKMLEDREKNNPEGDHHS